MKICKPFTIYDLRFSIGRNSLGEPRHSSLATRHGQQGNSCHLSPVTCHREQGKARHREQDGIALVITLIMLAVTLVMAVAFLALARRERGSVSTNTDTIVAQNATQSAFDNAMAQINANFLSGTNGLVSSNAYNLSLIVSTNYINPLGFTMGSSNPTNVNYNYVNTPGYPPLTVPEFEQNVSNLWYLPRVPVFVPTNLPSQPLAYDFRYYLDLNENGRFETNGWGPVFSGNPALPYYDNGGNMTNDPSVGPNYIPPTIAKVLNVGDPEWVGQLQHPDAPHGPNNQFVSRYAFIAVPVGNTLDANYIHNQAKTEAVNNAKGGLAGGDGYFRNQGVGSWELNLAGFLADLNTNIWGRFVGSGLSAPAGSANFYEYNEPAGYNSGIAFEDARALLSYRYNYNYNTLPAALSLLNNANTFLYDGMDDYTRGPLQTTLDFNEDVLPPAVNIRDPWLGADNTNHFFTLGDLLDPTKFPPGGLASFTGRLSSAGKYNDTYDRYTFYRMLSELGTDSSPDEGKLDLNYSNAVVSYSPPINGVRLPTGISIIPGAETNLVRWYSTNFFHAAADRMLRTYSSFWYNENPVAYTNTFGITNAYFTVTNIPVWVSNRFVYTPAVNRLLQMAANIYDATTNGNNNLPHVFKPIFERVNNNGDIFIVGYEEIHYVSGPADFQLQNPIDITDLTNNPFYRQQYQKPIISQFGGVPVNVYGVPWIIGAKKGLPNFNQFYMTCAANVTRKLQVTRTSLDPRTARYGTNQMYIIGISNNLGVSFWNSYNVSYPRPLTVAVREWVYMGLTNNAGLGLPGPGYLNSYYYNTNVLYTINPWPGSQWTATQTLPNSAQPNGYSFLNLNSWAFNFINPSVYRFGPGFGSTFAEGLDPIGSPTSSGFEKTTPPLPQLPQFEVAFTNRLQAFILDGNNVIDYVQLRDPLMVGGLNRALADPDYPSGNNVRLQWSTNAYPSAPPTPYGVINQIAVSGNQLLAPPQGGQWSTAQTPMGDISPAGEAAYFRGFFAPTFQYLGKTYVNHQLVMQVPYTPSRTVYSAFLLQANDPLVHYLGSDLNSQVGTWAVWNGRQKYQNGVWSHSDDPQNQPLPSPPPTPIGGRYQPWGRQGQMGNTAGVDGNTYNLSYKDPLVWGSDYWDFPTNLYPTVGWLGRVHRGTPWQTVYLKSTNVLSSVDSSGTANGFPTWANWTGNIQTNIYAYYFDNFNAAPQQDYLLFDIFTTRFNDNAARGTLPVNVGVGSLDGGLAAWSALFSGMVALTNNAPLALAGRPVQYTYLTINPAGTDAKNSPLWKIVNDPVIGINATRTNKNWFPYQTFAHPGQILATPALSVQSPFLNLGTNTIGKQQWLYGINDEEYEWLPQQMMGLVRGTEQRYVLYCFGQALRPAPNGMVLSGPYYQMITNYQVVAESAVRAVIRVDNANTGKPHAVVESYNVLPPN